MSLKLLFLSFFLHLSLLFSQEPAHFIVGKDALEGVALFSMTQDKSQNLWISSSKGLCKFNGIDFEFLQPKNAPNNSLFGLTKDNFGDLYCFNLNGVVFKVVNNQLEQFYNLENKIKGSLRNIAFDNQNNLILLADNKFFSVDYKNSKINKVIKNRGFITVKKSDSLFYGADFENNYTGIVSLYNNKEKKRFSIEKTLKNHELLNDSKLSIINNTIYGFNKDESVFFKIVGKKIVKIALNFKVNQQTDVYYSNNSFWFSNIKNGTYKLDVNQINTSFKNDKWFLDYYISGVYKDTEGNTWLLTFGQGLIMIPNIKVTNYKNKNIIGINKIDNQIFFSTKNDEIFKLEDKKLKLFFKTKNDRLGTFNIFKDKEIIVTQNSVYYKNKKHNHAVNFNRKAELLGDTIFVALHAGLYAYNFKEKKQKKITSKRTSYLYKSEKDSTIWVSSNSGLFKYRKGKITYIKHNNKTVFSKEIIEIENNNLLVASTEGVLILNKEGDVQEKLTITGDLKDAYINHIDYESPYIYLSSDKAIQQINMKNNEVKSFTYAEGLTSSVKRFKVLNDTVYALNSKGFFTFTFKSISSKTPSYNVKITNAKVNGFKPVLNNVSLPPNQNNIEFLFNTASFKYQKNLRYYYQLKGYDSSFVKAKNNQYFAKYSKIPSGTYTFLVKSFIGNHENSTAKFNFKVKKQWYKHFWFKVISVSLLLLILYLIYRARISALNRNKKEVELNNRLVESSLISLKAQMNPHFMFNAINSVQSLILKSKKDEAYKYLTKFSRLIRESLKMSDRTWVYLEEEINQLTNYLELEKLRFNANFSFSINAAFNYHSIKIPSMVTQPFIENSIKHGLLHKKEGKLIEVNFYLEENSVICIIQDTGVGRVASKEINKNKLIQHTSFSTQAIQKRFTLLREYLQNDSLGFEYEDLYDVNNKPTGTKVKINLPFINDDQ